MVSRLSMSLHAAPSISRCSKHILQSWMCSGTSAHKGNLDTPKLHELGIHGHEIRCQVHECGPNAHFADEFDQDALTTQFEHRELLSTLTLVQRSNESDQLTNSEPTFWRTHRSIVWSESGPSTHTRRVFVSSPSRLPAVTLVLGDVPAAGAGSGCCPAAHRSIECAAADRRLCPDTFRRPGGIRAATRTGELLGTV